MTEIENIIDSLPEGESLSLYAFRAAALGVDPEIATDDLKTLVAEVERLRGALICDSCNGTGKPISGLECICGGTGKTLDAVINLRKTVFELEEKA